MYIENHIPFCEKQNVDKRIEKEFNEEIDEMEKGTLNIKTENKPKLKRNKFSNLSTFFMILFFTFYINPMIFTDIGFSLGSGFKCLNELNLFNFYITNIFLSISFIVLLSLYLYLKICFVEELPKEVSKIHLKLMMFICLSDFICNLFLTIQFERINDNSKVESCPKDNINYFESIFIVKSIYYLVATCFIENTISNIN